MIRKKSSQKAYDEGAIVVENIVTLFVNTFLRCFSTIRTGEDDGDPFFLHCYKACLSALLLYVAEHGFPEDQTMNNVRKLAYLPKEELDHLFTKEALANPNALSVKKYELFSMAPQKTALSVLSCLHVDLTVAVYNKN